MGLTRLSALDGEAILPLADAKLHLRVDSTDEDTLIEQLRNAAIGHVERVSGIALAPTQYRWTMRAFPNSVDLPVRPVSEIGAVSYLDASGVALVYAGARLVNGAVWPAVGETWPYAYDYAAVEFTAGLTSPDDAPELIAAVKLMLGHLYAHREGVNIGNTVSELPLGVTAIVDTYRQVMV